LAVVSAITNGVTAAASEIGGILLVILVIYLLLGHGL
jgi:hypothetical protein